MSMGAPAASGSRRHENRLAGRCRASVRLAGQESCILPDFEHCRHSAVTGIGQFGGKLLEAVDTLGMAAETA
ncbi:hypothetical protein [Mesorhizobium sp. SP-1A]|uniref:hypothetical protein n=1 Tax=Mesorhizobium sp. SP-1A TaxID=3077840 RepID=UPI0028F72BD8|nr:hypothetical protein [Mesorhizobium sp. SP-1A]